MSLAPSKLSPLEALGLGGTKRARPGRSGGLALPQRLRQAARRLAELARRDAGGLELELPDRTVHFRSLAEFEFALASKTEYPVGKVAELIRRPAADLRKVATHIRLVEKRFAQVLTESLHDAALVGELMREVEIKLFSKDHGWRDLVESLNQCGPEYDEYKRLALIRYMQYLGSRQDVLRSIYLDKMRGSAHGDAGATLSGVSASSLAHDTALFDLAEPAAAFEPGDQYVPLPRGETVQLTVSATEPLELLLSSHAFRLYGGRNHYLIDENGEQHLLRPGKNMVGRQVDGDVVVDARLRAVSRRHLIIETIGEDTVALTDVSAHGTSMLERFAGTN